MDGGTAGRGGDGQAHGLADVCESLVRLGDRSEAKTTRMGKSLGQWR